MERLQIIMVMLACVPGIHTPRVATSRSHVDSGKLLFTRPPTISFADLLC